MAFNLPERILDDFQHMYQESVDVFDRIRDVLVHDLENVLRARKISHIPITARVKTWDRASKTAKRRYKDRCQVHEKFGTKTDEEWKAYCKKWSLDEDARTVFETGNDVYDALHDLVGARIALYFPDDVKEVESALRRAGYGICKMLSKGGLTDLSRLRKFDSQLDEATGTEIRQEGYEKAFTGYGALHVIANLPSRLQKRVDLPLHRWETVRIEIQIGTVVMHAWSEVEHDIIYKPYSGFSLGTDVRRMLDLINGVALTGEVALRQLQATMAQQEKNDTAANQGPKTVARDHHEFGRWLDQSFAANNLSTQCLPLPSEWKGLRELFEVLKAHGTLDHTSVDKLISDAQTGFRETIFDELVPLRILVTFANQQPERTEQGVSSNADDAKARLSALRAVSTYQLATYLNCDIYLFGMSPGGKRPSVVNMLDILHSQAPRCEAQNAAAIIDYRISHLSKNGKEADLRIAASFRLANIGFYARAVHPKIENGLANVDPKPSIPGRFLIPLLMPGQQQIAQYMSSLVYSKYAPAVSVAFTEHEADYHSYVEDLYPVVLQSRLATGDNELRWQCLYGEWQWRVGFSKVEAEEPALLISDEAVDTENLTRDVWKWLHRGESNESDDEDVNPHQDESSEADEDNGDYPERDDDEFDADLVKVKFAVDYRSRLHPRLSTESEKTLWIGLYGIRSKIGPYLRPDRSY